MTDQAAANIHRIEQLVALTERLTTLIAGQAKAFEARRPQDAAPSIEEASRLANIYRKEAEIMRAHPSLLNEAPLKLRHRLVQATEAFDAVIARQGRAILVQAIAEEVATQRTSNAAYGPKGSKPAISGAATAVTLNQRA
jgi:hypothetical protein